jgi:hypothetical protein
MRDNHSQNVVQGYFLVISSLQVEIIAAGSQMGKSRILPGYFVIASRDLQQAVRWESQGSFLVISSLQVEIIAAGSRTGKSRILPGYFVIASRDYCSRQSDGKVKDHSWLFRH